MMGCTKGVNFGHNTKVGCKVGAKSSIRPVFFDFSNDYYIDSVELRSKDSNLTSRLL